MTKGYAYLTKEAAEISVARYVKERSKHFEVAIEPDLAAAFREGKIKDVREALKSEDIFTDAKKGLRPSGSELLDAFGTDDRLKIAEIIIRKGLIQYSDKYRDEQREQKKRRIMELVRINCIDGQTGHPLPLQRIENAFAAANVRIKEGKGAEDQLQDIIKELRAVLPIKMETKNFDVIIPAKYASRSIGMLKQYGAMRQDNWKADGSFNCKLEIPAGLAEEFFDKVNALSHGEAQINEIR
jgi:ribosome maturation protein SDO1